MNMVQEQGARASVKSEVARLLIDAMERGDAPWQRPWTVQGGAPMHATNLTTGNAYKGVNRILLAIAGAGYDSNHWMTFQQAASKGWKVRKGEKGSMIVKVVELGQDKEGSKLNVPDVEHGEQPGSNSPLERNAGFALKRYWVFNADQVEGIPRQEVAASEKSELEPVERAEDLMSALKEKTGLLVIHGGDQACYVPALDEIRLPPRQAFHSVYDLWATQLHEAAHSTMHKKRLDRGEAYAKRWGDSAYALEELTAEIASAILASETGVPMCQDPKHLEAHGSYLRGWIKAIEGDPVAIFTAAKNADRICEYMLALERQMTAMQTHKEWIEDYENARTA